MTAARGIGGDVARRRLAAQALSARRARSPAELVARLCALQAQDYHACLWAVGMRLAGDTATAADVARALDDGTVLRTHALRGTWQLVTPEDAAWLLPLVGPRVIARAATRYRQLGLDDATLRRGHDALARALEGGRALGRTGLREALAAAGVEAGGQRLAHILAHAELSGVVCSAGGHGAGSRTMLLADRAPRTPRRLTRTEAAAELARRYFASRGPATLDDFVWWSGLPAGDARAALEAVRRELVAHEDAGGVRWRGRSSPRPPARAERAHLVPAFDEYLVAYRRRDEVLAPEDVARVNAGGGMLSAVVLLDGRVAGTWRRTLSRTAVTVEIQPLRRLADDDARAVARAAERYAAFVDRSLALAMKGGARDRKRRAR